MIYLSGFSDQERQAYKPLIYVNIVGAAQTMITQARKRSLSLEPLDVRHSIRASFKRDRCATTERSITHSGNACLPVCLSPGLLRRATSHLALGPDRLHAGVGRESASAMESCYGARAPQGLERILALGLGTIVRTCARSLLRLRSFIRSFIHSCVRAFVQLFVQLYALFASGLRSDGRRHFACALQDHRHHRDCFHDQAEKDSHGRRRWPAKRTQEVDSLLSRRHLHPLLCCPQ